MTDEFDRIAAELHTGPPAEFVAARDERVRQAKENGEAELAKRLGKLRRPTQSAWLVNRIVRERPELLEQIVDMAAEFHGEGLTGQRLRELSVQRQQLMQELGRAAESLGDKPSAETVREVESTFTAVLADPEVPEEVRQARLEKPLVYAGFGGAIPVPAKPPEPTGDQEEAEEEDNKAARAEAEREFSEAQTEVRESEQRLSEAERQVKLAQRDVAKAKKRLEKAQRTLDDL